MKNIVAAVTALLILIMSSCNDINKKTMDNAEAQTLLTEAVVAYNIYSNTQEDATRTGLTLENSLKSGLLTSMEYPQVTVQPSDLTSWPKTITVNYGEENVTGVDGHNRRGIMVITAQNFPTIENASWVVTFDEYYFDDNKVEGTQTVKYTGANENGHPEYQCTLTDGIITTTEEKTFRFEQQTLREWISGYDTHYVLTGNQEDLCDDEYQITGTHSGVSSDGYTYTMSTSEPLLVNVCCKWIMEGKLQVNLNDAELNCEIDYHPATESGDLCNNQAVFTIFGVTVPITLP